MKTFFALVATAIAAMSYVAADAIPEGSAAHFFTTQNSALALSPQGGFPGAILIVTTPGDGSSNDISALYANGGSGVPTQIVYGDWCVTAAGVIPGGSTQTLYIDNCSDDPAQIWTVNDDQTISNADGNCVTLGKAAKGAPVTLSPCAEDRARIQGWNPIPV